MTRSPHMVMSTDVKPPSRAPGYRVQGEPDRCQCVAPQSVSRSIARSRTSRDGGISGLGGCKIGSRPDPVQAGTRGRARRIRDLRTVIWVCRSASRPANVRCPAARFLTHWFVPSGCIPGVGDDNCCTAVIGVKVMAVESELEGCRGADELAVQNYLANSVLVVAADPRCRSRQCRPLLLDCPPSFLSGVRHVGLASFQVMCYRICRAPVNGTGQLDVSGGQMEERRPELDPSVLGRPLINGHPSYNRSAGWVSRLASPSSFPGTG